MTGRKPAPARIVRARSRMLTGSLTNGPLPRISIVSPSLARAAAASPTAGVRLLPPAEGTPHAPGPSLGASGPASPEPAWLRPAFAARHTLAARVAPPRTDHLSRF